MNATLWMAASSYARQCYVISRRWSDPADAGYRIGSGNCESARHGLDLQQLPDQIDQRASPPLAKSPIFTHVAEKPPSTAAASFADYQRWSSGLSCLPAAYVSARLSAAENICAIPAAPKRDRLSAERACSPPSIAFSCLRCD